MGTGGGSPKKLQLTSVENALIDFLTPDAAGLSNISEGGLENISNNNSRQDQYSSNLSPSIIYSSAQKEKRIEEIQYYSSPLSFVEDETNIDKIYISDTSEDLMPLTKKLQFKRKCETTVSLLHIEDKENIQVCIKYV